MFVQIILFNLLISYCITIKNDSYGLCERTNLCQNQTESCHPVVMKCHHDSCDYRRFTSYDDQRLNFSRWFYDSHYQRCRRYKNQIENVIYFQFLRDCRRLCPIRQQKKIEKIITLHVSDTNNYNDTVFIDLHVDLSPRWVQRLANLMNVSTLTYNSQKDYFQNYRRHFTNFVDPTHQFMISRQGNINEKKHWL